MSIKRAVIILTSLFIASCASTYSVKSYDNNVFEVAYSSEKDSYHSGKEKKELLAAYVAESKGCKYFDRYLAVGGGDRSGHSLGVISTRRTVSTVYHCVEHDSDLVRKTKQVIQILESRYGSLRNMKRVDN